MRCRYCGAELRAGKWQRPLARWLRCRNESACKFRIYVQSTEPPEPIDYEQPPEDIWICSTCGGAGEYQAGQDWETGALRIESCANCGTTGVQPGYKEPADA